MLCTLKNSFAIFERDGHTLLLKGPKKAQVKTSYIFFTTFPRFLGIRPVPNFFRKKKKRERKKLFRCFGFSFLFAVPNIFYRYRTIENFYAHHIIIFKYKFEKVYPFFLALKYLRRISTIFFSNCQIFIEISRSIVIIFVIE